MKTMFVTGESVGLAEWIIDDTCLVLNYLSLTGQGSEFEYGYEVGVNHGLGYSYQKRTGHE